MPKILGIPEYEITNANIDKIWGYNNFYFNSLEDEMLL